VKVLVIGGSGFLGRAVVRLLGARGHGARVLDRMPVAGVDFRAGDISDLDAVRGALEGCDGVINLAALLTPACQDDPILGARINVIGTLNVFEAAREAGLDFVCYTSSASVFGAVDPLNPAPDTHYGAFKLACEGSARAYWIDHGIASFALRPFVIYGPEREVGLSAGPSLACKAAAAGRAYTIPLTGTMGLVYVRDVAEAFVAALERGPNGAEVYTACGVTADVSEFIAELAAQVQGCDISAEGPPMPVIGAIEAPALPWGDVTPLAEGIAETLRYYAGVTEEGAS